MYVRNVKGCGWNHKRVYRIYCELELNLRIRPRNRPVREVHQVWSMGFMHDALDDAVTSGSSMCWTTSIAREWAIEVDLPLPSAPVIRTLQQAIDWRGKPPVILCDNGPEYVCGTLLQASCGEERGTG